MTNNHSPGLVDLVVNNLDQTINHDDLKNFLLSLFQEHAMVRPVFQNFAECKRN